METLLTIYPNANDLLNTPPDDLAPVLLKLARSTVQNGMFWPDQVNELAMGTNQIPNQQVGYPFDQRQRIGGLLSQVWNWLERYGLIVRAEGMNGRNGWMIFTKEGEEISDAQDLRRIREAAEFPKTLIHPSIREKVWRAMMRNDLDEAVRFAFIAVEEAVRKAGGFTSDDSGVKMMRDAFHKDKGTLRDPNQPEGQREALPHLFAGAFGFYRNFHAHHTVSFVDLRDAQERIVLASHLLRIVDAQNKT